ESHRRICWPVTFTKGRRFHVHAARPIFRSVLVHEHCRTHSKRTASDCLSCPPRRRGRAPLVCLRRASIRSTVRSGEAGLKDDDQPEVGTWRWSQLEQSASRHRAGPCGLPAFSTKRRFGQIEDLEVIAPVNSAPNVEPLSCPAGSVRRFARSSTNRR